MRNEDIVALTQELSVCLGYLCRTFDSVVEQLDKEKASTVLEYFAFLVAHLYRENGIDLDEAISCLACFIGINMGGCNSSLLFQGTKDMEFYIKILTKIKISPDNAFFYWSIIIYNFMHPNSLDDFSNRITIESMSMLEVTPLLIQLTEILSTLLPQRINPILARCK